MYSRRPDELTMMTCPNCGRQFIRCRSYDKYCRRPDCQAKADAGESEKAENRQWKTKYSWHPRLVERNTRIMADLEAGVSATEIMARWRLTEYSIRRIAASIQRPVTKQGDRFLFVEAA